LASQPTATVTATTTIAPTPTETLQPEIVIPEFFTENFDGKLENWDHFVIGDMENEIKTSIEKGFLNFEIVDKEQSYYTYYTPKTYSNVRIDVTTENRGNFNSVTTVICRYQEDEGWYEFDFDNGGIYRILYVKWNNDKVKTSPTVIAKGGSNLINTGKSVNNYSVICNDRTLSLWVNGTEVSSLVDDKFTLEDGYIGIGAATDKIFPIENRIDSVTISKP